MNKRYLRGDFWKRGVDLEAVLRKFISHSIVILVMLTVCGKIEEQGQKKIRIIHEQGAPSHF
jgi:hypothetical protein